MTDLTDAPDIVERLSSLKEKLDDGRDWDTVNDAAAEIERTRKDAKQMANGIMLCSGSCGFEATHEVARRYFDLGSTVPTKDNLTDAFARADPSYRTSNARTVAQEGR